MIGAGKNLHHPVYVEDLIDGFFAALDRPEARGEVFQFSGERPGSFSRLRTIHGAIWTAERINRAAERKSIRAVKVRVCQKKSGLEYLETLAALRGLLLGDVRCMLTFPLSTRLPGRIAVLEIPQGPR